MYLKKNEKNGTAKYSRYFLGLAKFCKLKAGSHTSASDIDLLNANTSRSSEIRMHISVSQDDSNLVRRVCVTLHQLSGNN